MSLYTGPACTPGHEICFVGAGNTPKDLTTLKYQSVATSYRPNGVLVHVWRNKGFINTLYCCPAHQEWLLFSMLKAGLESDGNPIDSTL